MAWARALGQCVDPPPTRERRGPIGQARGSEASGVPKFGGRGIVRSSCSFGTHMASPFSFLGRQCCFRGRAAGGGGRGWGWWERVLCWDEALYPHIFMWEWESGSSVALLPSVASSAQGPSGFCLLSGVTGFGLRFGGLGLCLGLGLGLALGIALALALEVELDLDLELDLTLTLTNNGRPRDLLRAPEVQKQGPVSPLPFVIIAKTFLADSGSAPEEASSGSVFDTTVCLPGLSSTRGLSSRSRPHVPLGRVSCLFSPHCQRVEPSSLCQRYKNSN